MNRRAHCLVCATMAQQRPDPTIERFVERTYVAMRALIAATPLGSTGLVIGACVSLTNEAEHTQGIVRLLTLGKLHPEMEAEVTKLVDLVIADKLPGIRAALARQ